MSGTHPNTHVSAETLQALLDGDIPSRDRLLAEEHLAACGRCAAELDAWRVLLEDLDGLAVADLAPGRGFAERVIAGIEPRATTPARLGGHIAAADLQSYLDGALGARAATRLESHIAACTSCGSELDAWSALVARLEDIGRFAPSDGFADRVVRGVELAEPLALPARVRAWLTGIAPATTHPQPASLAAFVDRTLPDRPAARVADHLAACASCEAEVESWRGVFAALGTLERFEPSSGFAARVMDEVRVPTPAEVAARTPVWAGVPAQLRRYARRVVPRTRKAWATISGMAVTPAVVSGLVLWAVFSHPTLTPSALLSFLSWQVADLFAAGWAGASALALESAGLFDAYALLGALASAPVAVGIAVLGYSAVSAVALRVLYKNVIARNVIANRPVEGRYVRASAS